MALPSSFSLPDRLSSFIKLPLKPIRRSTSSSKLSAVVYSILGYHMAQSSEVPQPKVEIEAQEPVMSCAASVDDDLPTAADRTETSTNSSSHHTSGKESKTGSSQEGNTSGSFTFSGRNQSGGDSITSKESDQNSKHSDGSLSYLNSGVASPVSESGSSPPPAMNRSFSLRSLGSLNSTAGTQKSSAPEAYSPTQPHSPSPLSLLPNSDITSQVNLMLGGDPTARNDGAVIPLPSSRGLIHLDADIDMEHVGMFFPEVLRSSNPANGAAGSEGEPTGPNGEILSDNIDITDYKAALLTPGARYRALCRSKIIQAQARLRAEEVRRAPRAEAPEPCSQLRPSVLGGWDRSSPLRYSAWTWKEFEEYALLEHDIMGAEERAELGDSPTSLTRVKSWSWFRDRKMQRSALRSRVE